MQQHLPLLIGTVQLVVGSVFFGVSLILAVRKMLRIKSWTKTTGVVVDVETSQGMQQPHSTPRNTLYKPTVRFQTTDGRVIDYEPQTSNSWSNYSVGQSIPVYYDPRQPEKAFAGTNFSQWFGLILFGVVGGFFALMGAFFLFMSLNFPF